MLKDGREYDPDAARITYRCAKCLKLIYVITTMNKVMAGDRMAMPRECPVCTGQWKPEPEPEDFP